MVKEDTQTLNKTKAGAIEFIYTREVEFKSGEDVIGMTLHTQVTNIPNKKDAVSYLKGQLDNVTDQVLKIQTEYDKNDIDIEDFKDIGEYLATNKDKTPIKKLTKLNALYGKYENKTQLKKELDLYRSQLSKIEEQLEEVTKL